MEKVPLNKDIVGKYVILKDIACTDFMKDKEGNINLYDTIEQAAITCGMYEFEDVIIVKVVRNFQENPPENTK